jgi:hypothetical protein
LIFTDDTRSRKLPANVQTRKATLDELRDSFSKRLGFEVALGHSRLLCNMKPAFGFFFEDILDRYEFWGHCDLDMIFGNLRKFLTDDIFSCHDRILNLGHLCLYRNTPKVNRYFMLNAPNAPFYKDVFEQGVEVAFDEEQGIEKILNYHKIPQYKANIVIDVLPPTRWQYPRFEGIGIKNYQRQVFYWHNGSIFQCHLSDSGTICETEYAYIHFQKRHLPAPDFNPWKVEGFLITPDGFYPLSQDLKPKDMSKHNRARLRPFWEIANAGCRSLKRRLGLS